MKFHTLSLKAAPKVPAEAGTAGSGEGGGGVSERYKRVASVQGVEQSGGGRRGS